MFWVFLTASFLAGPRPAYTTAQERWECSFKGFNTEEQVQEYFGVYRSHVTDDLMDYTIAQNDVAALIFITSDYGNTDVEGKTRRWASVNMIDKRTRKFKRTVVDMDTETTPVSETTGKCQPY